LAKPKAKVDAGDDTQFWAKLSERAFAEDWNNEKDAVYNKLIIEIDRHRKIRKHTALLSLNDILIRSHKTNDFSPSVDHNRLILPIFDFEARSHGERLS